MDESKLTQSKHILIITYYWPPAGGIAVRRWLALANELSLLGVKVSVLTLDSNSAEYPVKDEALESTIHSEITVYRIRAFNPYKWVKRWFSNSIPEPAFAPKDEVVDSANWLTVLRSHFFIPDPRRTWNRSAVKQGFSIIREQGIDTIITSSPPSSVHLIGLKLRRKTGVHWVADFRDPWTDIFYYSRLGHSRWSHSVDKRMELRVLTHADQVLTVSWGFAELLSNKLLPQHRAKFHVLTNGMDFDPCTIQLEKERDPSIFRIVYTGVLAQSYQIEELLNTLSTLSNQLKSPKIVFDFYGRAPANYLRELEQSFDFFHFHGSLPQREVLSKQVGADALFLIGPANYQTTGHIPGKLFEYLGARRPILYLGQQNDDVMRLIQETHAGICLARNNPEQQLEALRGQIEKHPMELLPTERLTPYLRHNQAQALIDLLQV